MLKLENIEGPLFNRVQLEQECHLLTVKYFHTQQREEEIIDIENRNSTQSSQKNDQDLLGDFDIDWDCNLCPLFP
jgi:hypothetical protein